MKKRLTHEKVINRFKKVHDNYYDYSLVVYRGDSEKVKIICPQHGLFEQTPGSHGRQKQGCPKCWDIRRRKSKVIGNNGFIKRIEEIYGKDKFDYSKLIYMGAHIPVTLTCVVCGNEENKAPSVWYRGFGCLKCKGDKVGRKLDTKESFITKARKIHGNKYDYSKVQYIRITEKIEIMCPKHGSFFQTPDVHLYSRSGCPKCKTSKGEETIAQWLNDHDVTYIFQYKVKIDNSNHYFDFYLPEYNIVIEFNGEQHYKPIKFFGGNKGFEFLQERDKIKKTYCVNNNLELIIIDYKDDIEEILTAKHNELLLS